MGILAENLLKLGLAVLVGGIIGQDRNGRRKSKEDR